jgi:hypothetical protein
MRQTVFCLETKDFAVIEDTQIVDKGVIRQHQGDWFFVDGEGNITEKVYAEFNRDPYGGGLFGPNAPEMTATKTYKRANAFLKAISNYKLFQRLQSR